MKSLLLLLFLATALIADPVPPGVVIYHTPAADGFYIGSPSICIAPNGDYLASHDLFGPKSSEHQTGHGRLYRSTDKGITWTHQQDFTEFFWTGLFTHRGNLYTLGTDKHHGRLVIRRSTDNGHKWTDPSVIADGQWHTAPVPVIEHDGRIWRAFEDAHTSTKWGERYRARMISAPTGSDLLDAKNWTISNPLARDTSWLDGRFAAWLEGNAVATPEGKMINFLRVAVPNFPDVAAIVEVSADGKTVSFDPATGFVPFSGGSTKFQIRKDPKGPGYWALANIVPERHQVGEPGAVRNTLALVHSTDLRTWETRCILLYHPDAAKHGFQYPDWQFDGDDIIAASRTAFDDGQGGAHNFHDANFLTFHRFAHFRKLSRNDDVPMPQIAMLTHETTALTLSGSSYEIATLKSAEKSFSNRDYQWLDVPQELAGRSFTRLAGGGNAMLNVTAKQATTVVIATDKKPLDLTTWKSMSLELSYSDKTQSRLQLYQRPIAAGEILHLPRGSWAGAILIFPND